jgi:hypothetical protein
MLVFTTVLFVDGKPVTYSVFKESSKVVLRPDAIEETMEKGPEIMAKKMKHQWKIKGTNDQDLVAQVIEDLTAREQQFHFVDNYKPPGSPNFPSR